MNIRNTLSNIAKTVMDKVTQWQNIRKKSAEIKSLDKYGTITGATLSGKSAEICIDHKKYRVFIRTTSGKYVCEYNCWDVEEFMLLKHSHIDNISDSYSFRITFSSGEMFVIEKYIWSDKWSNIEKVQLNMMVLLFSHAISDDVTKRWTTEFFTANDLPPLFDEDGNPIK